MSNPSCQPFKNSLTPSRVNQTSQIQHLYNQFQSLKSQIYGFEQHYHPELPSQLKQSQRKKEHNNQDKAAMRLKESTIRKYSFQFSRQIQNIQKKISIKSSNKQNYTNNHEYISSKKSHQSNLKDNNKIPFHNRPEKSQIFDQIGQHSKQFPHFEDYSSQINKNEALFHQLIKNSSQIAPKKDPQIIDLQKIKESFELFSNQYTSFIIKLDSNLKFINQRLRCLQLVFTEFTKIKYQMSQTKIKANRNEKQLIIDIDLIQSQYQNQIKSLTTFHERRVKQMQMQYQQQLHKIKEQFQLKTEHKSHSQKSGLKSLLQKAKNVIATKQQLITSLQQENEELRHQIDKLSTEKQENYLLYSSISQKAKINLPLRSQIKKQKPHPDSSHSYDEIHISQLKREKTLSEWEESQLDLRHSNTKSDKEELHEFVKIQET